MGKNVLVVEDNVRSANLIKKIITSIDSSIKVYVAENSEAAYKYAMEKYIDVFILDIILDTKIQGDTSGIKFAKEMRSVEKYLFTPMIFMTSLEDPAMYAFRDLHCYGYLEKPFDTSKAEELIREALKYEISIKEDETIYFRKDKIIYPFKTSDIVFTCNNNHTMVVHHKNGTTLSIPYKTCSQLLNEVKSDCLMQCNRNTLVNKQYIKTVDLVNRYITLTNQERVEIGGTYLKKVERELR